MKLRLSPFLLFLTAAVLALWLFPAWWYTSASRTEDFLWFRERKDIAAWSYSEIPVSAGAQSELGSDQYVNGEFRQTDGRVVRVFSAKRYADTASDVDIFAHTPDRCWPLVGWRLHLIQPETVRLQVAGHSMQFERRLYSTAGKAELVYFGALVGGRPLPYRLDQYVQFGLNCGTTERSGTLVRAKDGRFWRFVWESFLSRRPLRGAKHFVRISTPVAQTDIGEGDELLSEFVPRWLENTEFETEFLEWTKSAQSAQIQRSE